MNQVPAPAEEIPASVTCQTYRLDRLRAPFQGVLEAGWQTMGLLVAIRAFNAPDFLKAMIPASGPLGLLLSGCAFALAGKSGIHVTLLLTLLMTLIGFLLMAAGGSEYVIPFVVFFSLAHFLNAQQGPFMFQVYCENYSSRERGSKVAMYFLLASSGGMTFSFFGGRLLDSSILYYPLVIGALASAAFVNAILLRPIPSSPVASQNIGNPVANLALLWQDKVFGWLIMCWMLMGVGNLMTIPLRVEYVANPEYGINATNEQIALMTFIIPAVVKILSVRAWGRLFDHMNFITWRILINLCFISGTLLYFTSDQLWQFYAAAGLLGLGTGGGLIAWNLWVTKVAPADKLSAYLSVHTATTGLRGVAAPFIGYYLILHTSPTAVGWMGAGLILTSTLMFAALIKLPRMRPLQT